ncbi:hypothetical protein [Agrobacterium rosae]|uniref:hypothetical protein n=1 Tax=Agrobacterium rosae TaxID=1972867 RepID=UPI001356665B|nr:hypothetical protein [Agrobacterium rosae]
MADQDRERREQVERERRQQEERREREDRERKINEERGRVEKTTNWDRPPRPKKD